MEHRHAGPKNVVDMYRRLNGHSVGTLAHFQDTPHLFAAEAGQSRQSTKERLEKLARRTDRTKAYWSAKPDFSRAQRGRAA